MYSIQTDNIKSNGVCAWFDLIKSVVIYFIVCVFFYIPFHVLQESGSNLIPDLLVWAFINAIGMIAAVSFLIPKHPILFLKEYNFQTVKNVLFWGVFAGTINSLIQFPWKTLTGLSEIPYEVVLDPSSGSCSLSVFLFLVIIVTPILEEILFRYYLFQRIKRCFGSAWGHLITALLFTLCHTSAPVLLFFPSALLLTFIFEKTQHIETSIIAHIFWNLTWFSGIYSYMFIKA